MTDCKENRHRYKKTPAGWFPKEWDLHPLCDVASVQTGIAKGKNNLKRSVSLPYLRVANVQDGHVDLSEVKEIYIEVDDIDRYRLKAGDVLFTEGGDFDKLGRGCVWAAQIDPCLHQNHIFAVRCNDSKLRPYYLASLASSPYGRHYFALSSKQSTNLASINSTQLKAFPIPLPPLQEQSRIVEILSFWDEAIKNTRNLIAAAKQRKKALMQQLLTGKKRWPGYSIRWTDRRLRNITHRIEESPSTTTGLPVLSITSGKGFVSQQEKFSRVIAGRHIEHYVLLRKGEFSYNKGNSFRYPQGCAYRLCEYEAGLVPDVFFSFRANTETVAPEFLEQFFLADLHGEQLRRWVNTGVRNNGLLNLNASDFFNLRIAWPDLPEQRAIASVLATADEEINALDSKCKALEGQRKGLMQKLLTGEVRVVRY